MTAITPGLFLRRRREAQDLSRDDLALMLETTPPVCARERAELLAAIEEGVQPISIGFALVLHGVLHFDWHVLVALSAIAAGIDAEVTDLCRVCACSEHDPCADPALGSCAWAEPDLCTACHAREAV